MKQQEVLEQINKVLQRYSDLVRRSQYSDCSDQPKVEVTTVITLICECIRRFAPAGSQYRDSLQVILKQYGVNHPLVISYSAGILQALRVSYEDGYLANIESLIRGDLFSDFIDMASHLLSEKYKDAAAVITGSVLEEHLRRLCFKNGIDVEQNGRPKKADQLNSELSALNVYSKLDQKNVTAWLGLRNQAAHGQYDGYTQEMTELYIQSVRDFIARVGV